jgi:hypothetical protein
MRIERFDAFADFQSLETAWNTVYQSDPEAQFFLSWRWLAGVLEKYPGEWLVLAAYGADSTALGFLPLRRKTFWSKSRECLRNELHFAGRAFWADYGGILCVSGHEESVLSALAAHLKQMDWSHLYLKEFRISERRFELFMAPFDDERLTVESRTSIINNGQTDNLVCPYVDLPATFDAYLAEKLSGNTRQKLRRFLRKIESSPEYKITTATAATQARDLPILETLWSGMWSDHKGSETKRLAAKYKMIVQRGLDDDLARLTVLWYGDKPVGALASFLDWEKSRLLFFVTGRDEKFLELPVGLVLHASNIRWAIENGLRTYDFLRGNEAYKYSFGAAEFRLKYQLIRTHSGVNLNGKLDPVCITEALGLAISFAKRKHMKEALAACRQILAAWPEDALANRLLKALEIGGRPADGEDCESAGRTPLENR